MKQTFFLILVTILVSSCSVEKRRYQKGYHVNWHNSKREVEKRLEERDSSFAELNIADSVILPLDSSSSQHAFSAPIDSIEFETTYASSGEGIELIVKKSILNTLHKRVIPISPKEVDTPSTEEINKKANITLLLGITAVVALLTVAAMLFFSSSLFLDWVLWLMTILGVGSVVAAWVGKSMGEKVLKEKGDGQKDASYVHAKMGLNLCYFIIGVQIAACAVFVFFVIRAFVLLIIFIRSLIGGFS